MVMKILSLRNPQETKIVQVVREPASIIGRARREDGRRIRRITRDYCDTRRRLSINERAGKKSGVQSIHKLFGELRNYSWIAGVEVGVKSLTINSIVLSIYYLVR